jgi:AcrR family transcriptional regulator
LSIEKRDMAKRIRIDGEKSRELILEMGTHLAAREGLERLSLARLARAAGMSKSGVFGLFGSKEELQLAIIDSARALFIEEVIVPALSLPRGRERLLALCEGFIRQVEERRWPEGCFFASVAAEVGGQEGPLRDRVAEDQSQWVALLRENAEHAAASGELALGLDPAQLALELSTMLTGADLAYLLHGDPEILKGVRKAFRPRLR